MRANVPHIFAIGDIVGQPVLAHQAQVAEVIAGELPGNKALAENRKFSAFNARVIPSVVFTDPKRSGWVSRNTLALRARH